MRLTDLSGYFQELYRLIALAFQLMALLSLNWYRTEVLTFCLPAIVKVIIIITTLF